MRANPPYDAVSFATSTAVGFVSIGLEIIDATARFHRRGWQWNLTLSEVNRRLMGRPQLLWEEGTMLGDHDSAPSAAFNVATAAPNKLSLTRPEKPDDKSRECRGAGHTVRRARAAEVLAALLGLFASIFFSNLASAQMGASITFLSTYPDPSPVGNLVTFEAMVTGESMNCILPGGTVTFFVDGSLVGTGSAPDAIFTTKTLALGTHNVVANYGGDFNCFPSSDMDQQIVVGRAHDFNGDGMSDIAWRDGSGDIAFWLMNGAAVSSTGSVGGVPGTWSIVGQRDFNGDGKADLLWLDTSGNIAMWFMNGAAVGSTAGVAKIPTNWSVAGVADFNGDGLADILWRDTAGDYAVWLMNGATVTSSVGLGNVSPTTWSVVGTGDFNGDGRVDILWRDTSGNTSIWFMNLGTVAFTAGVGNVPTNWSVVGTGDFNGDGMADIVWRDTVGDTSIWLMNGAAVSSAGGIGTIPTTWSIALVGDYNGDGMSDLLWRDTGGNTAMWFMNGTTIASTAGVGNIPTNWTVQSANAE